MKFEIRSLTPEVREAAFRQVDERGREAFALIHSNAICPGIRPAHAKKAHRSGWAINPQRPGSILASRSDQFTQPIWPRNYGIPGTTKHPFHSDVELHYDAARKCVNSLRADDRLPTESHLSVRFEWHPGPQSLAT